MLRVLCVLLFLLLGFRLFVVSNTFVHVTVLFNVVIVVFLAFLVCLSSGFVFLLCLCLYMCVRFLV